MEELCLLTLSLCSLCLCGEGQHSASASLSGGISTAPSTAPGSLRDGISARAIGGLSRSRWLTTNRQRVVGDRWQSLGWLAPPPPPPTGSPSMCRRHCGSGAGGQEERGSLRWALRRAHAHGPLVRHHPPDAGDRAGACAVGARSRRLSTGAHLGAGGLCPDTRQRAVVHCVPLPAAGRMCGPPALCLLTALWRYNSPRLHISLSFTCIPTPGLGHMDTAGLSLRAKKPRKKGFITRIDPNVHGGVLCFMVKTWARHKTTEIVLHNGWRLAIGGGWWLAVSGWWRLVVGGWWRLVVGSWWWAVGGGWWLSVGGGWWWAVGGGWQLVIGGPWGLSLTEKMGFLRTALGHRRSLICMSQPPLLHSSPSVQRSLLCRSVWCGACAARKRRLV